VRAVATPCPIFSSLLCFSFLDPSRAPARCSHSAFFPLVLIRLYFSRALYSAPFSLRLYAPSLRNPSEIYACLFLF